MTHQIVVDVLDTVIHYILCRKSCNIQHIACLCLLHVIKLGYRGTHSELTSVMGELILSHHSV